MTIEYFLYLHRYQHLLLPPPPLALPHIHLHDYSQGYHLPPLLPNYFFLIQRTQDDAATNSLDISLLSSTKFSETEEFFQDFYCILQSNKDQSF